MEFQNVQSLSQKEIGILQSQRALTQLKTQIESDQELKNRFVDHYLKYMERSKNEQSKKYITALFMKAVKFLAILNPTDSDDLTSDNLKDRLTNVRNIQVEVADLEGKGVEHDDAVLFGANNDSDDTKDMVSSAPTNEEGTTDTSSAKGSGQELSKIIKSFSGLDIDISKPLSIADNIDFGPVLKKLYFGIQDIKKIALEFKKYNMEDIDRIFNEIQTGNLASKNKLEEELSDIITLLPKDLGIQDNISAIMSNIATNPDILTEFKKASQTIMILCKSGFIETVCDELIKGGMTLYQSLPVINPDNVNNHQIQQQFIETGWKIAKLLKSSLQAGYNVAKNSNYPGITGVLSQIDMMFLSQFNTIPDHIDTNDPKRKEEYYRIITIIDKVGLSFGSNFDFNLEQKIKK